MKKFLGIYESGEFTIKMDIVCNFLILSYKYFSFHSPQILIMDCVLQYLTMAIYLVIVRTIIIFHHCCTIIARNSVIHKTCMGMYAVSVCVMNWLQVHGEVADRSGRIKAGDKILSINLEDISQADQDTVRHLLQVGGGILNPFGIP